MFPTTLWSCCHSKNCSQFLSDVSYGKLTHILRQLQTSSTKSIVLFQHYKESLNHENLQQTFPTIIQNWKRLRKLFTVSFKCIIWKIDSYLRQLIVLFQHCQKSLNRENSQQTFPTVNQNWKRLRKLFTVSFKCIVWKIDSYLRQLIILFLHYQKSLNCENLQQAFPTIIQNWKRLRKLFTGYFKCIVWKINSYLRQLQTSNTKSIVLFPHYKKSLHHENSQ